MSNAEEATTRVMRVSVWAAPRASFAVVGVEHKPGSIHGKLLVDEFLRAMRQRFDGTYHFPYESLRERDGWAASGVLVKISIVQHERQLDYSKHSGLGNTSERTIVTVAHVATPPKCQSSWPKEILEAIRNRTIGPTDFLSLAKAPQDDGAPDDVLVTVKRDGRTKTFVLGNDDVPNLRIVLTEVGDLALDLDEFHKRVEASVRDVYHDVDMDWKSACVRSDTAKNWVTAEWPLS